MGTFGTPSSYNNTGALGSATNPTTAQGLSRDRENQKAILELPGTQAWVEKTITDGVIIPTSAEIIVLPEGGASTDQLTTIALTSDGTTTLHEGMLIRLKAANSNTITVVHGIGTNNISTIDGNNIVLDTTWYIELKLIGGLWVQQETNAYRIANAAGVVATNAQNTANTAVSTANAASSTATNAASAADKATTKAATSATAAGTAAKEATCTGFSLSNEARVFVTFSNANTVADAITLNVNSTGAKAVYNERGATSAINIATWLTGVPIEFVYDGTNWRYKTVDAVGNAIGLHLYVRDEKAPGTNGGATSSSSWHTRDLNTVKFNAIPGASVANNQITLPAGRYLVFGRTPSYAADSVRAAIYNVTAASYVAYGSTIRGSNGSGVAVDSTVEGIIELSVQSVIELRMWARSAYQYGLGYVMSDGYITGVNEVYSELRIWKM